jgi:hypothetical protein
MAGISKFKSPQHGMFHRIFGSTGAELGLRVEARKGGESKIKTKYLENYNLLDSTFLISSIVILLCGIMFKAAELPPGCVL